MSFKPYPAYKDSGVEWLGRVPEGWAVYSLKRTVEGCVNGIWGNEPDGIFDIAVIRVADFNRNSLCIDLEKLTYRSITYQERASRLLIKGDLLIEKSGGGEKTLVGCVVLFEHEFEAVSSNFVARMRPKSRFNSKFLCYAFNTLYEGKINFLSIKQTTGIQNLDSESYLKEYFCFPPLPEQQTIAAFLDHETARIDALIASQHSLIALLKEKRQALISHAVTRGLDPTVKLKDSGVEWLGMVPEHWEVIKFKHLKSMIEQGWSPQCEAFPIESPEEWGVLKVGCVNGGKFNPKENKSLPPELEPMPELAISKGDLLISRANTRELVGSAAVANDNYPRLLLCDKLYRIRLQENICLPEFWGHFFGINEVRGQIELAATGASSSMLNISQSTILEMTVFLPPLPEQQAIVAFLDSETAKIDSLVAEAEKGIELLKERRSALISAGVTGQIDLRGWQAPEVAA